MAKGKKFKSAVGAAPQQATPAPQIPPVVVVSIVYAPPLGQVIKLEPQFPVQLSVPDMLHVLRAAQEQLIAASVEKQIRESNTIEKAGSE